MLDFVWLISDPNRTQINHWLVLFSSKKRSVIFRCFLQHMKKRVLQKQFDEKRTEKRRKKKRKIKGDKEKAGSDDHNAQKIAIRALLIISIDLFQNNLR